MSSGYFFQSNIWAKDAAGPGHSGCVNLLAADHRKLYVQGRHTSNEYGSKGHSRVPVGEHEYFHEAISVPTEVVVYEDEGGEQQRWDEGGPLKVEGKETAINDTNPSKDLCVAQRDPPRWDGSPWLILRVLLWAPGLIIDVEL